jgi:hypothetical protein
VILEGDVQLGFGFGYVLAGHYYVGQRRGVGAEAGESRLNDYRPGWYVQSRMLCVRPGLVNRQTHGYSKK